MPQATPVVSVVIPSYNAEDYISECLDSILAQTFTDFECIVVDDGSTDKTPTIVKKYAKDNTNIKLIQQENAGQSIARNVGLDHAVGDYIIFLDSDDWFHKDLLKSLYKNSHNKADIVVCNADIYHNIAESYDKKIFNFENVPQKRFFWYKDIPDHILDIFGPNVWNKLFKREFIVHNNIRFIETIHRAEDRLFVSEALVLASCISVIDESLYYYRRGISTSSTATLNKYAAELLLATEIEKNILEKHKVYKVVERSFKNSTLDNLRGILIENEVHLNSLKGTYARVKKIIQELGYTNHDRKYFYNDSAYDFVTVIATQEYGAYLQHRIIQLREHEVFLTQRLEATESRRVNEKKGYESEIKRLRHENNLLSRRYLNRVLRKAKALITK